jgi:hypothetical protein
MVKMYGDARYGEQSGRHGYNMTVPLKSILHFLEGDKIPVRFRFCGGWFCLVAQ